MRDVVLRLVTTTDRFTKAPGSTASTNPDPDAPTGASCRSPPATCAGFDATARAIVAAPADVRAGVAAVAVVSAASAPIAIAGAARTHLFMCASRTPRLV